MSTSLPYQAFGVHGYRYVATHYGGGSVTFSIEQPSDSLRCPVCGSRHVIRRGTVPRRLRTLPIGRHPVWLAIELQRVLCLDCHALRQVNLQFAEPGKSYSRAFERYVLDLSQHATIQDVARHLQVSWGTIKDIQKRHLQRRFKKVRLKDLRQIAIDEIYVGRKHFLTIVLDLDTGAVVFVGEGRSVDSLKPFWIRLGDHPEHIQAVAMDMSAHYQFTVRENLPDAVIVFDHFHLIKLYNEKLMLLRRTLQAEAVGPLQKAAFLGSRWLLLKNPENLTEVKNKQGKNEKQRLQELLELNQPLTKAYLLKEELRQLWNQKSKPAAEAHLNQWVGKAEASGVAMLKRFAKFLQSHRHGILAWYDYPISTGPLEGINNKIKTMQRQAYGYRDHEFFKLKIKALHEAKLRLVG